MIKSSRRITTMRFPCAKRSAMAGEPPVANLLLTKTRLPPISPCSKRSLTASTLHHRPAGRAARCVFFLSREQPSRSAAAGRAALRRALESAAAGWEPPCATVGAARVVHQALPCYRAQAQARLAIEGGGADGAQLASSLRWRACSQPSAVWILQACGEAGHAAKKARKENPTPSRDAQQPSLTEMWSPRVSPIWSRPYRLCNSPSGNGSTSRSLSSHCRGQRGRRQPRLPLRRPRMPCQVRRTRSAHRPAPSARSDVCGCSLAVALPGGYRRLVRPAAAGSERTGPTKA